MAYSADSFTAGEVPTTAKWNKLWSNDADFDTRVSQAAPVGVINPYGGSTAPTGWLICDGSAVSRTTYAALFAILGTTYGAGNGSTTFNLPNFKGKVPFGRDSGQTEFDVLGETGGSKSHTHPLGSNGYPQFTGVGNNIYANRGENSFTYNHLQTLSSASNTSGTIGNAPIMGGTTESQIELPPYQVINYIVKI